MRHRYHEAPCTTVFSQIIKPQQTQCQLVCIVN